MNLGAPEIIGIIVLALLLFGSRKLPELGSSVGKTITNFKQGIADAKEEEEDEAVAPTSTTTTEPVTTPPVATPPSEVVDRTDRA